MGEGAGPAISLQGPSSGLLSPHVKTHLAPREGLPCFISSRSAAECTTLRSQLPTPAVPGKGRAPSPTRSPVFKAQRGGSGSREVWALPDCCVCLKRVRFYLKTVAWARSSLWSLFFDSQNIYQISELRVQVGLLPARSPGPQNPAPQRSTSNTEARPFQDGRRPGLVGASVGTLAGTGGPGSSPGSGILPASLPSLLRFVACPGPAAVTVLRRSPRRVPALKAEGGTSLAGGCHLAARRFPSNQQSPPPLARWSLGGVISRPILRAIAISGAEVVGAGSLRTRLRLRRVAHFRRLRRFR